MREETFKAENVDELVWLRLNRLKSVRLCENLIQKKLEKAPNSLITESVIKSKAIGLSSAINSAIGYWQVQPQSLNAKILSRYYFLLQMTIAEQVSSMKNEDDLKTVQRHTENGHGLGTIIDPGADFPHNYFSFAIRTGHFYSYAKSIGIDTKKYDFESKERPRVFPEIADKSKIVSLIDLFRRIPELNNVIEEYTDLPPLSFHIGHSDLNIQNDIDEVKKHIEKTGKVVFKAPITSDTVTTFISFYNESEKITPEFLASMGLPMTDFAFRSGLDPNQKYITAKFVHPAKGYWHQHLKVYHSAYATSSIIAPLWNEISDSIIINFILLYTLSILARYRPDHWYRINSGDLNHVGSLIEYYISTIDHVIPLQMLERITEARISIHQPGSIFGPV